MACPGEKRASAAGLTRVGAGSVPVGIGVTVNVAVRDVPPNEPLMVTAVEAVTAVVVTVQVALVAPAATVTLPGTVAAALLLDSVTALPPVGATALSVTVPCDVPPPVTLVGLTLRAERVGADGAGAGPAPNLVTKPSPQKIKGS